MNGCVVVAEDVVGVVWEIALDFGVGKMNWCSSGMVMIHRGEWRRHEMNQGWEMRLRGFGLILCFIIENVYFIKF